MFSNFLEFFVFMSRRPDIPQLISGTPGAKSGQSGKIANCWRPYQSYNKISLYSPASGCSFLLSSLLNFSYTFINKKILALIYVLT